MAVELPKIEPNPHGQFFVLIFYFILFLNKVELSPAYRNEYGGESFIKPSWSG